jgi:hypothetical protein
MFDALRRHGGGEARWPINRRPHESPAGLRILLPGCAQFAWGQHERGWVLLGSFVVGLAAGVLTWGTWLGWACCAFAFFAHVTSTTDAIRQASFPADPRRAAWTMTTAALAVVLYLPALSVLLELARPGFAQDRTGNGYLINCWAYRDGHPFSGDWVWLRLPPLGTFHAAQVVALPGQEVEWTGQGWRVDGKEQPLHAPLRMTVWPQPCRFRVPPNQILVEPEDDAASQPAMSPLVLVDDHAVVGRAWAQFYPVWDRRLL